MGISLDRSSLIQTVQFVAAMVDNTLSRSGLDWRGFVDQYVYKPMVPSQRNYTPLSLISTAPSRAGGAAAASAWRMTTSV